MNPVYGDRELWTGTETAANACGTDVADDHAPRSAVSYGIFLYPNTPIST